jgi:serine/threonine protein kinase
VTDRVLALAVTAPGRWEWVSLPGGVRAVAASFPGAEPAEVRERLYRWRDVLEEVGHPLIHLPIIEETSDGGARLVFGAPGSVGLATLETGAQWADVLDVVSAVEALCSALHERGLVHGNLGSASLWRMPDGSLRVPDAALALAFEGIAAPALAFARYHDPAVSNHGMTTPESDQYALAVLTNELITGHEGADATEQHGMISVAPVQVDALSSTVVAVPRGAFDVLLRAKSGNPAQRYPSCAHFVAALRALTSQSPPPAMYSVPQRVWRGLRSTVGRAGVTVALLVAVTIVWWESPSVRRTMSGEIDRRFSAVRISQLVLNSLGTDSSVILGSLPAPTVVSTAPRVGTLEFAVPRGTVVYVDGVRQDGGVRRAEVSPGVHDVHVRVPGQTESTVKRLTVQPGETVTVRPR